MVASLDAIWYANDGFVVNDCKLSFLNDHQAIGGEKEDEDGERKAIFIVCDDKPSNIQFWVGLEQKKNC